MSSEQLEELQEERANSALAEQLNISIDELNTLKDYNFEIDYYKNNDGVLLKRIISFSKGAPKKIINKIKQSHLLSENFDDYYFYLPLEDEPFEEDYSSSIYKENHTAHEFDF